MGVLYKKSGVLQESLHLPIVQEMFIPQDIEIIAASDQENISLKVDYWGIRNKIKQYGFDFKTAIKPWQAFGLTYDINKSSYNVFNAPQHPNITSIFLLHDIHAYAFLSKRNIHEWFMENKPFINPGKTDDSTYFWFPRSVIEKLAKRIVCYDEYCAFKSLLAEGKLL